MTVEQQEFAVIRLRVELFAAAQRLTGVALADFWKLIDEIVSIKPVAGEVAS